MSVKAGLVFSTQFQSREKSLYQIGIERHAPQEREQGSNVKTPRMRKLQIAHQIRHTTPNSSNAAERSRVHQTEHAGKHMNAAAQRFFQQLFLCIDQAVLLQSRR